MTEKDRLRERGWAEENHFFAQRDPANCEVLCMKNVQDGTSTEFRISAIRYD